MELAVKTKKKAEEILQRKIYNVIIRMGEGRCECGQTLVMLGYDHLNQKLMAKITVCDACGDDNRWEDDVLDPCWEG